MDREILEATVDGEAEDESEDTEQQAEEEELVAVDTKKLDLREVGQFEIGFAAGLLGGLCQGLPNGQQRERGRGGGGPY